MTWTALHRHRRRRRKSVPQAHRARMGTLSQNGFCWLQPFGDSRWGGREDAGLERQLREFRDRLHAQFRRHRCRVGDPDRKGKVEAGVGHAQKTPLRGLRFESLAEAQAYLDRWETRWADTRIHGTTKRQVAVMFAEEQPALGPLPLEPFRYYRYGER